MTIPVIEERLFVSKRAVAAERVVLRTTVEQHDEIVEALLRSEDLAIERVPIDKLVDAVPPVREEDGVVIVPVMEERVVVETRLVLREEIHIRRKETVRTERRTVPVRREVVDITRTPRGSTVHSSPHPRKETAEMAIDEMSPTSDLNAASSDLDHHIVATYETYADARAARDKLVAGGIPTAGIELLDRNAQPDDSSFAYDRNTEGFWGAIKRMFMPDEDVHGYAESLERGHAMLVVRPTVGQHDKVIDILDSTNAIDFDNRQQEWRGSGWTGTHAGAPAAIASTKSVSPMPTGPTTAGTVGMQATAGNAAVGTTPGVNADMKRAASVGTAGRTDEMIPVVEEQLRVGKRDVSRGSVRVRSYVVERPVHEQVNLRQERVEVERHKVDRPLGAETVDPFRERTIEVSATDEEAVISKEARVVEEIAVRKEVSERTQEVNETVRRTEVEVEDDSKLVGTKPVGTTPARPI